MRHLHSTGSTAAVSCSHGPSCPYFRHNRQHLHLSFHRRHKRARSDRRKDEIETEIQQVQYFTGVFSHHGFNGGCGRSTHFYCDVNSGQFLDNKTEGSCALQTAIKVLMSFLCKASLLHLVVINVKHYLATMLPFEHISVVTAARLLIASTLA